MGRLVAADLPGKIHYSWPCVHAKNYVNNGIYLVSLPLIRFVVLINANHILANMFAICTSQITFYLSLCTNCDFNIHNGQGILLRVPWCYYQNDMIISNNDQNDNITNFILSWLNHLCLIPSVFGICWFLYA